MFTAGDSVANAILAESPTNISHPKTLPYLNNNPVVNPADDLALPNFRRNYVDGVRLNFNNGQFGFVAGLHNGYFTDNDHLNDVNIGLDIAHQ